MTMQIFVDADACPEVCIVKKCKKAVADLGRILLVHKHQNSVIITKAPGKNGRRKLYLSQGGNHDGFLQEST